MLTFNNFHFCHWPPVILPDAAMPDEDKEQMEKRYEDHKVGRTRGKRNEDLQDYEGQGNKWLVHRPYRSGPPCRTNMTDRISASQPNQDRRVAGSASYPESQFCTLRKGRSRARSHCRY